MPKYHLISYSASDTSYNEMVEFRKERDEMHAQHRWESLLVSMQNKQISAMTWLEIEMDLETGQVTNITQRMHAKRKLPKMLEINKRIKEPMQARMKRLVEEAQNAAPQPDPIPAPPILVGGFFQNAPIYHNNL